MLGCRAHGTWMAALQVTVELPCITSTPSAAGASSQGEDAPDGGEGVQLERVREGMKTRLLDLRV